MILTLFITFVALSLVILAVGVWLDENYFSFVALFFLFLLGNSLLFVGVDYRDGEDITTIYSYVNGTLSTTTEVLTYSYSNFKDDTITRWFGFLIAITSAAGMAAILTQARQDFKSRYDKMREFGE